MSSCFQQYNRKWPCDPPSGSDISWESKLDTQMHTRLPVWPSPGPSEKHLQFFTKQLNTPFPQFCGPSGQRYQPQHEMWCNRHLLRRLGNLHLLSWRSDTWRQPAINVLDILKAAQVCVSWASSNIWLKGRNRTHTSLWVGLAGREMTGKVEMTGRCLDNGAPRPSTASARMEAK